MFRRVCRVLFYTGMLTHPLRSLWTLPLRQGFCFYQGDTSWLIYGKPFWSAGQMHLWVHPGPHSSLSRPEWTLWWAECSQPEWTLTELLPCLWSDLSTGNKRRDHSSCVAFVSWDNSKEYFRVIINYNKIVCVCVRTHFNQHILCNV